MRLLGFAASTLILAACGGSDPLLPELGSELTRLGGCGDVVLYASDENDRVVVTFQAQGFVENARSAEEDTEVVLDLSMPTATAHIDHGERVSSTVCNDVIVPPGPRVDRTWTATAGTATLRIRPASDSGGAFADLVLEDVVFSSDGAEDLTVEELTWADVFVGWYPG